MVSLEFFIDIKSFRSHYGPGVDSAPNGSEYQEYFLGVTGLLYLLYSIHTLNVIPTDIFYSYNYYIPYNACSKNTNHSDHPANNR